MVTGPPLIINGLRPRSGTTFLKFLLSHHPDLYLPKVDEDYLSFGARHLADYAAAVVPRWHRRWGPRYYGPYDDTEDALLSHLGGSLLTFIGADDPQRRPILKTPFLTDVDVTLRMFPGCAVIVVLRDPRAIAHSFLGVQKQWGMNQTLENLASLWAEGIRRLEALLASQQDAVRSGRLILLRYEELYRNPSSVLNTTLTKAGLNPLPDVDRLVADMPVYLSSAAPPSADDVIRDQDRRPADFDPLRRWHSWSERDHARFVRICGTLMERWGYPPDRDAS